jgi:hypothetical protein
MTDEERQRLCDWLRHLPSYLSEDGMRAADEIERLAEELQHQHACDKAQQQEIERLTTLMSGNVRLVEELDDGAIFKISPLRPRGG